MYHCLWNQSDGFSVCAIVRAQVKTIDKIAMDKLAEEVLKDTREKAGHAAHQRHKLSGVRSRASSQTSGKFANRFEVFLNASQ